MLVDFARRRAAARRRPVRRRPHRDRRPPHALMLPERAPVVRDGDKAYAWRVNGQQAAEGRRWRSASATRAPATFVVAGGPGRRRPRAAHPELARCKDGQPVRAGRSRRRRPRRPRPAPDTGATPCSSPTSASSGRSPTVVHHHRADGLGLLALKKLRVNQIPDVEQPVHGGRRSRIRAPRPRRSSARSSTASRSRCRASRGSTRSAPPPARAARSIVHRSSTSSKNMIEASDEMRNAIATVRYKLPIEMREPVLHARRPVARSRSCSWRCRRPRRAHAEISRLAEDELADRFRAHRRRGRRSTSTARCKRELSVLLHAEKLREYNVSVTEVVNALRSAEHHRAGGPVQRRAGRPEHPPGRPHRVAGRVRRRSSSSAAATRSCAWARWPTIEDGFAEHRRASACATASPTSASRSRARATRAR